MPTVIVTPGGTDSNSYASVAEADSHFDTVLYADDWTNASTTNKEKALIMATALMENCVRWRGVPTSNAQALQWPRRGVLTLISETGGGVLFRTQFIEPYASADDGLFSPLGIELATNEIPQFLKNATAELARSLLGSNRIAEQDSRLATTIQIPGLSVGYIGSGGSISSQRKLIPPNVYQMIAYYAFTVMGHTARKVIRT